jgi:dissimilatory sulfite reductase related protein
MPILRYKNMVFDVDEEGYLKDLHDWCPEWVECIRISQGIVSITDEHWRLIKILQEYYREHKTPPLARHLSKATGFKMKHIFELFPDGPGKGACKMAGLPKPKGCV